MIKFFSIISLIVASIFVAQSAYAGTLSCSIIDQNTCNTTGSTTVLRMSGSSNAHAQLAGSTGGAYDGNVVCCTGVTGLSSSCASAATTTIVKLSGNGTNSHVEQSGQANYTTNACLGVGTGGTVSVGYQATNCTGYDTTLFSMSGAGLTNTHVGTSTAYTNKVCASATSSSGLTPTGTLTSSLFDSAVTGGAGYNSIMWVGTIGTGKVKFQFATSDCVNGKTNAPTCNDAGVWTYIGGANCDGTTWFDAPTSGVPVELKGVTCQSAYNNKRYFRYKVLLCSGDCTTGGTTSPVVSKIVVSWAP